MSCPSYERENNLCHSFFSARAAHFFTNNTDLEYNFLENYYLISQNNDEYLPLQFPSSYTGSDLEIASKGNGIVWLIIQLDEYSKRGGDIELIESFKLIIFNKLNDLKVYTNELGLLENIPQAITFGNIDWKDCNIDFISNMLFCYALGIAGRLYNDTDLLNEAKKIYTVINSYSYNGEFYVDSANRDKDGKLCLTNVISDECQYFAYFCDIASPNSNPTLWNNIINKFDKVNSKYDFRKISNDFIGLYIRFDLLWRYNLKEKLKEEIQDYFLEMANKTGTLWEKNDIQFSCNHGYAACVAFWLGTTQYSHRLFSEHYAKR